MTIFKELINLKEVNLNNNNLEVVSGRIFKDNLQLEVLKFATNIVDKTDIQDADFFENLKTIDVRDNPCTDKLGYNIENSEVKDFLDEYCKADCEDQYKWLMMENEELSKSYNKVKNMLDELNTSVTSTTTNAPFTDLEEQTTEPQNLE
jgi:hypothetical protein